MASPLNPPDTPPRDPRDVSNGIPEGLATKVGKYGALVFFAAAVAVEVFDLEVDLEALFIAGLGGVTIWTMMWGRFRQAVAALEPEDSLPADVPDEDYLMDVYGDDEPMDDRPELTQRNLDSEPQPRGAVNKPAFRDPPEES